MFKPKQTRHKGQSLAEYGLILALIACFCIAALTFLGQEISTMMNTMATTIVAGIQAGIAG